MSQKKGAKGPLRRHEYLPDEPTAQQNGRRFTYAQKPKDLSIPWAARRKAGSPGKRGWP
jgi:hypothetical protein